MSFRTPKEYKYSHKQTSATLVLGYDKTGRLFSRIEKNGEVVATNMYVKMPSAEALDKQGWVRSL